MDAALPESDQDTGVGAALAPDHPLVVASWLAVGLVIAAGLGPLLSKSLGFMLPAFAIVRTARRDADENVLPAIQRPHW